MSFVNYEKRHEEFLEMIEKSRIARELEEKKIADAGYANINEAIDKFLTINKIKSSTNVRLLNIKYRSRNVIQVQLKYNKFNIHTEFTRARLQKLSNKLSSFLHDSGYNGMMSTSIKFEDLNWRSGYLSDFGSAINLYEPSDSDKLFYKEQTIFDVADFYIFETGGKKGGCGSVYNDCFYDCLVLALLTDNVFKGPEDLKNFLKIDRFDKVSIEHIPAIEKKLKCIAINVSGDHSYISTVQTNKVIDIILINDHYKLDTRKSKKVRNISYTEKKIVMYNSRTYEAYNGEKQWKITGDEIRVFRKDAIQSEYILVSNPYDKVRKADDRVNFTLKMDYDQFLKDADILKKETKGVVNLYKTGDIRLTSLNLFDKFSKTITEPEKIDSNEAMWLSKSNIGALITWNEYEGVAYEYDYISMYPNFMNSGMLMPVKRGEFKKLSTEEFIGLKFYQYGIFRCKISRSEDENANKLFRFNFDNYYTHFTLNHANILGLKIELIQDDEPNFLYYSRDKCLTCHEIFGKFIDFGFELKEKKLPFAKSIINILWGALGQKICKKHYVGSESKVVKIKEHQEILYIKRERNDDDRVICNYYSKNHIYHNNFARICPFLIARGRLLMAQTFNEHRDQMVRIHTDGFYSKIPLPVKCGSKMGQLKCKINHHTKVINNGKPEGDWIDFDNNKYFEDLKLIK